MVALLANSDKQNAMQDADDNDSTRVVADVPGPSSGPAHPGTCAIAPGDVLGDRYRIIEHIGKGGMGDVVLAEHIAIGRKVAIKTLHGDFLKDPEIARRFLYEARTASQIRHPNVVDITDFGHTDRGAPFFVMELLEGEDLRALLAREQTLAWPRVCAIVLQICRALTAAHAHGVIHRDMKPDNVYIIHNPDTTEEVVKVLDFGIAKTTTPASATAASDSHEVTRTGVLLGTPHYMSPEQAQDEPLDPRSDIYAVGVLLYRMTTGTVPFRGKSFMKVLSQHLGSPPPPPRTLAPDLDPTHEQIILQCLAKQPEDRYPSAEALAAALAATLDTTQTAIRATPTPAPKRRGLLVAGTLVLGAGLLVVANSWPPATPTPPVTTPVATPTTVQEPPSEPPPKALAVPQSVPVPDPEPVSESSTSGEPPSEPAPEPDTPINNQPTKLAKPKLSPKQTPKPTLTGDDLGKAATSVKSLLRECPGGLPGMVVKVDITVNLAGKVIHAQAHKPQSGSALGQCVEQAAIAAKFPALTQAQSVTMALRLP